ncbi:MAG: hypothetical protein U0354_18065 [Candidatus Sericytochromatia bacterium]
MSFSVSGSNQVNQVYNTTTTTTTQPVTTTTTTGTSLGSDSVNLSSYSNQQPLPTNATTFKKIGNSFGEFFSNVADKLGFGETRKLLNQEFSQVDQTRDGTLNKGEFNVATLNLLDFMGTEFARADKDRDGRVNEKEYANYRKEQIGNMFDRRETSGDKHLNINEIGFIGQQFLINRDPRLDENQDGLVNKREFTRGALRGTMNIRDLLGL